ncbi:site-specific integrase [Pantoea ananatis]|uniref:tyrosine-type recombinase/integrase n=1 Tax=Pantoea ananas TaxID=553 RepID=UPI0032EDD983
MDKNFSVNAFVIDSGERYCLVMDRSSNLPEYYTNLFLTTQMRNRGDAFATMVAAAGNLVLLLHFLKCRNICLEQRFLNLEFLKANELDDLRDFSQRRQEKRLLMVLPDPCHAQENILKSTETVNNGTQYSRLTTFASYLRWFAMHVLNTTNQDIVDKINYMTEQIKERRPAKKGRNGNIQDKSLSNEQLDALFEIIRLGSILNPFNIDVQRRNRLMILLLYYLGIRGGELLNIRIRDIDFGANRLKIVRRADELGDPRINEPNAKTRERILPMSDSLAKELHDYITQDRKKVRYAAKNDFLFITYKNGPTLGQPLSKVGYYKVFAIIRAVSPQLYDMTGHMFRHTWNRKFSEKMDTMDEQISEERQEKIRSFLMGWKEGSGTSTIYNKRFIRQKGFEAALALQGINDIHIPSVLKNDDK